MSQSNCDQRRAFLSAPSPERYFAAGAIEDARQRIVRAIARSEGPAILVGGAGTGKSLLLAVLAEQFAGEMAVVTLAGAQLCTRRALLQMILFELGLEYRNMDEGELRLAILSHLRGIGTMPANTGTGRHAGFSRQRVAAAPTRLLLLVDEADALPIRLLEELRVLTNVSAAGAPLVSLVLAGGPILEERFAEPQLDMFAQRLAARCYLAPLGHDETHQYVRSQAAAVGIKPEKLFTVDAYAAIHSATGGVPRLVNQLGDQLVWMAHETGVAPLDASLVQQAWSDLQQLPAPWNHEGATAAPSEGGSVVIEFGELDAPVASAAPVESVRQPAKKFSPRDVLEPAELDDEMPASIPIESARPGRLLEATLDLEEFDASLDAAEDLLVESFDEFDGLTLERERSEPAAADSATDDEPEPTAAQDPFAEPFDEEEIVLDPYSAFESELLRAAPQVINRLDRAFASELHRCVQRATNQQASAGRVRNAAKPTAAKEAAVESAAVLDPPIRLHETAPWKSVASSPKPPTRDLFVIEDDETTTAAVVPGRQFRRLFSNLEMAANSQLA